jgi:antitoxin (DNA-binding transcriptional repressor) of toxin-antitoxin stability system
MKSMPISKFKATCLSVLEEVRKTRKPVLVTRFGEAIAEVVPPRPQRTPSDWIGSLAGTATIQGDIVAPLGEDDWESAQ